MQLAEYYHRRAALEGTYQAYTCAVASDPLLACLDVASATTLDGQMAQASSGSLAVSTAVQLFGGTERCANRTVGDGLVSFSYIRTDTHSDSDSDSESNMSIVTRLEEASEHHASGQTAFMPCNFWSNGIFLFISQFSRESWA